MLHAAAWTDVDGAEASPQDAAAVNVGGTQHVLELGAPVVVFSTDYVFDGRKREPYVESDAPNPALGLRPHEAAVRGRSRRRSLDRAHLLAPRLDEHELRPHDASPRRGTRRGGGRRRSARLAYLRRAPRGGGAGAARSPPRAMAPLRRWRLHVGRASPRRSSRPPESTAGSGGSRPPSSTGLHPGPRTRCCGASGPTRRRCRTGARACARASSG